MTSTPDSYVPDHASYPVLAPATVGTDILRPTPYQLAWQNAGLGVFFHFGINTFHGKEWSDGSLPAGSFDPSDLDADQWARTAAGLGAKYVILTAKHHDGFCLWPTATTDYSVASSPFRGGDGDVVREFTEAARRHGLRVGLYLSPWDRHEPRYPDAAAYDEFYLAQLRELCTDYGELFEIWFDGAGSAGRTYDWDRIGEVIGELQPQAMVFNMGPATIRWVGNENGLAADPCEYVTTNADLNNYDEDTIELAQARYLPPECDVSLRRGWFWQPGEEPKSVEHLLAIHDASIGLGANLLLNIPPDRRGQIDPADAARVAEFREALDARFGEPVAAEIEPAGTDPAGTVSYRVTLPRAMRVDHVELREDIASGQRVTGHSVLVPGDGSTGAEDRPEVLVEAGTIGVRRIHRLDEPREVDQLVVQLRGRAPVLAEVLVYDAEGAPVPALPGDYEAPTDAPID
jgi:alpha-L-fucosidase